MKIKRVLTKWLFMLKHGRRPARTEIDLVLAADNRKKLIATHIIGVTGSAGKSSTSALLFFLLGSRYRTAGSILHNALKDIAQRLIEVTSEDQYLVVEMSGHEPGALASGCALVQPCMAIITSVSSDHFANFRSLEATAQEKSVLASAVSASGMVFLNLDDPLVASMAGATQAQVMTFGLAEKADYRALNPLVDPQGRLNFTCAHADQRVEFDIGLPALHFVSAALAAIACAHQAGISLSELAERARLFHGLQGRCSVHPITHQRQLICDTVKAPYPTLELAFGVLNAFQTAPRKTIVLGNMSDYAGAFSPKLRKAVKIALAYADRVLVFRPPHEITRLIETYGPSRVIVLDSLEMLREELEADILEGEVVLLKASSVNRLDALVNTYTTEHGESDAQTDHCASVLTAWAQCCADMEGGLVRLIPRNPG
ncbi:Mur ligase family protein [Halopseudomonas pelagia]|uniref:Mur ligase family protein n=1 Tax=Halopseudomonas pelagia TaxID=553151 RepID=UPI0003A582CE|nr:Mur ligase family protein [Halopseudomonas pelagia]|tara:strand:- start:282184 stop:283470 length:1287 start_codon:yes stop_codon:yes gene_type:complete